MNTLKKISDKTLGAYTFDKDNSSGIGIGVKGENRINGICILEEVDEVTYLTIFEDRLKEYNIQIRHENLGY